MDYPEKPRLSAMTSINLTVVFKLEKGADYPNFWPRLPAICSIDCAEDFS
jgi:hypothetical protein